jgi:hypothetical protein
MRRVGVLLVKEYSMANILDISGKPLPPRRRSKRRLRARDMRDLLKVLIMLMMVITGYFIFAPASEATRASDADIARNMPAG